MMLYLVLLLSVVSVTSACDHAPYKWEGKEGFMMGQSNKGNSSSGLIKGTAFLSYDADSKMIAASEVVYVNGQPPMHIKLIQDFNKRKQYSIMTVGGKEQCFVTPTPAWTPPTIPENATEVDSSYYGLGSDSLKTVSYAWKQGGADVYLTIAKDSCVPIGESMTGGGQGGSGFMLVVGFEGITLGIKDMRVFDVPSICQKKGIYYQENKSQMAGVIRLRRSVY